MTPSITRVAALAASFLGLLLAACAGQPAAPPDIVTVNGLIPITPTKLPNAHAYEARDFDASQYHGLLIEPATISPSGDFGSVSEAEKQKIAAMLTSETKRELASTAHLVDAAGPGIVRIDMTLMGINESKPVLATALRLTPAGLAMSAARGVTDKPAPFTGAINIAGVAYDSQSGRVLAAVQAQVSPSAINLTSGLGQDRAAELATTRAAEAFRDYLIRVKAPKQ